MSAHFGYCHWHRGSADSLKLVGISEPTSYGEYACAPCREQHHLVAVEDVPVAEFLRRTAGAS